MRRLFFAFWILFISGAAHADLFSDWDKDGDGRLIKEEVPDRLRGNFDKVDADGSGWISRNEHEAVVGRGRKREKDSESREPVPGGYRALLDLPYAANGNPAQRLNLYLPEGESEKRSKARPLLVFIHGGAWRSGSKSGGGMRCHAFDPEGSFVYASIGYRLTGEAGWPAQIHDCKAAIRWLRGNGEKYGFDTERIAVVGSSAGGHLVAMLGVSGGIEELEGDLGDFDDESSRVTCVVNYFGPSNLVSMAEQPSKMDHSRADSPEGMLIGGAIPENLEEARGASPVTFVTSDDAPTLTAHGTEDPLVPFAQGRELDTELEKAGVKSVFIPMDGGGHGFRNAELERRVSVFLKRHLLEEEGLGEVSEEAIRIR